MKEHPTSVDKVLVCNLRKQSDEKAITSLGKNHHIIGNTHHHHLLILFAAGGTVPHLDFKPQKNWSFYQLFCILHVDAVKKNTCFNTTLFYDCWWQFFKAAAAATAAYGHCAFSSPRPLLLMAQTSSIWILLGCSWAMISLFRFMVWQ